MKNFRVVGTMVGSKYLGEIEAETAQEALDRAPAELDFGCNLCHHCSGQCEDGEIDHYGAEEIDGDESAQVDGFWEGQYYKAQGRVHELEQYMAKLVKERDKALEDAALAVESFQAPELVFAPGIPIGSAEYAEHPNRLVEKAAAKIRSLKREVPNAKI